MGKSKKKKPTEPKDIDLDDPRARGVATEQLVKEDWIVTLRKEGFTDFYSKVTKKNPLPKGAKNFDSDDFGKFLKKIFPGTSGPDLVALDHKNRQILVGDVTAGSWSKTTISEPGGVRRLPNELESEDFTKHHLDKTKRDAEKISSHLPEEIKGYEVHFQDKYGEDLERKTSRRFRVKRNPKPSGSESSSSERGTAGGRPDEKARSTQREANSAQEAPPSKSKKSPAEKAKKKGKGTSTSEIHPDKYKINTTSPQPKSKVELNNEIARIKGDLIKNSQHIDIQEVPRSSIKKLSVKLRKSWKSYFGKSFQIYLQYEMISGFIFTLDNAYDKILAIQNNESSMDPVINSLLKELEVEFPDAKTIWSEHYQHLLAFEDSLRSDFSFNQYEETINRLNNIIYYNPEVDLTKGEYFKVVFEDDLELVALGIEMLAILADLFDYYIKSITPMVIDFNKKDKFLTNISIEISDALDFISENFLYFPIYGDIVFLAFWDLLEEVYIISGGINSVYNFLNNRLINYEERKAYILKRIESDERILDNALEFHSNQY